MTGMGTGQDEGGRVGIRPADEHPRPVEGPRRAVESTPPTRTMLVAIGIVFITLVVFLGLGRLDRPAAGLRAATQPSIGAAPPTAAAPLAQPAAPETAAADPEPTIAPAPVTVPQEGSGAWATYGQPIGASTDVGSPVRIAVRVEDNMPIDAEEATRFVMTTLQDQRGWQPIEQVAFELVTDPSQADVTISIASPDTVDRLCAPIRTGGELSCRNGPNVALNAKRWMQATEEFNSLEVYRQYLVNHEVGHALGHGHLDCTGPGEPAPVMQQQTKGLHGCAPNPWPSVA